MLGGIRVLDVTTNISGPSATMILAALGADVIKIERPGTGDDARLMSPSGAYFIAINRGKRSVALDLSRPEGVATKSAAIAGRRSYSPLAERYSMTTFSPSVYPVSFKP